MDDFNSETDSDYTSYWRDWILWTYCWGLYLGISMVYAFVAQLDKRVVKTCEYCYAKGYAASKRCVHPTAEDTCCQFHDTPMLVIIFQYLERYMRKTWSDSAICYLVQFISSRGNEYFCEIDEEYLTDRFNLTGLNTEVQYYQYALDLVTDVFDFDCDDEMREQIEKSARHLYGLVHARYIVTTRGLAKMLEKFKKSDFGKCPRVMCDAQPLLPMGQSDVANSSPVKLYCARCEDLYNPKSSRHAVIDGAYFGTSFHNILFQVYPAVLPAKSQRRYEPRVFGFKMHAAAALSRWQGEQRDAMKDRLRVVRIESGFEKEDAEMEEEEEEEEEEEMEGVDASFEGSANPPKS